MFASSGPFHSEETDAISILSFWHLNRWGIYWGRQGKKKKKKPGSKVVYLFPGIIVSYVCKLVYMTLFIYFPYTYMPFSENSHSKCIKSDQIFSSTVYNHCLIYCFFKWSLCPQILMQGNRQSSFKLSMDEISKECFYVTKFLIVSRTSTFWKTPCN